MYIVNYMFVILYVALKSFYIGNSTLLLYKALTTCFNFNTQQYTPTHLPQQYLFWVSSGRYVRKNLQEKVGELEVRKTRLESYSLWRMEIREQNGICSTPGQQEV